MTEAYSGPVEELRWTDTLKANVVTPGFRPRVHGYDVRGEMLGSFSFSGMIFLALTGELPSETVLAAFERVMLFTAPVSAAEAPVHASILAGLCGSGSSGLMGVSAITLAQRARWMVSKYGEILDAIEKEGQIPSGFFSSVTPEEKEETALLLNSLVEAHVDFPASFADLDPVAASLAVLCFCCNLTDPWLLEAVLVMATFPCTLAEGKSVKPGDFRKYPIGLPEFKYTDDHR